MKEENSKNFLKKIIVKVDSFFNDDTTYYAASLSFFTIFSVLPIIALILSFISTFPEFNIYIELFKTYIFDLINPTHSQEIIDNLQIYISNTSNLGYLGLVYMLFVSIMFFKDYEYIVNKIHKTKRKSIFSSFVFYSIYLFSILGILIAFNIFIAFYNNNILNQIVSYIFSWIVFFSLFKLSVNKYINTKSALISSLITLIALAITKNLFVYYVIYNKTYTTIYGSLATLLFTFFWIYVSWIIYLYGIKMCHKLDIKYKALNKI